MATQGNFKRKHYIAAFKEGHEPVAADFHRLGNRIATITDDSKDETDATVFYDSEDGNPEETLLSRAEIWKFEGQYDPKDPAHLIVEEARRSDDEGRKIWHKIEETNGQTVIGLAKLFDPVAGGGDASNKEAVGGRLAYIKKPAVTPATP